MFLLLGILLTLLVLLIVVMVHEFGHFITARLTGMKVEEFGIGIPPRALKLGKDKKGTLYTLNWLPIGGFVRIYGENPDEKAQSHKESFISKPWASRILVLVAGVAMNFLLAFFIFATIFAIGVTPAGVFPADRTHSLLLPGFDDALESGFIQHEGIIFMPLSGSIAEKSGIMSGEILTRIDHMVPRDFREVSNRIEKNETLLLELRSLSDTLRTVTITPENGKIGVSMHYQHLAFNTGATIAPQGWKSIPLALQETLATTTITWDFMKKIFAGIVMPKNEKEHSEAKQMVAGPIGMGSMFTKMVEGGISLVSICIIIAMISINLGVVNILPFPALDGGRVVTTTLYSLFSYFPRGQRYYTKFENSLNLIGFALLLLLMLYVAGLDISRFF